MSATGTGSNQSGKQSPDYLSMDNAGAQTEAQSERLYEQLNNAYLTSYIIRQRKLMAEHWVLINDFVDALFLIGGDRLLKNFHEGLQKVENTLVMIVCQHMHFTLLYRGVLSPLALAATLPDLLPPANIDAMIAFCRALRK